MDANSALGAAQNDYQAIISKKAAETAPVIDKASAALDQPRPTVPQQEKIGAAPAIGDFRGDAAMWANAMAAFSVIAGGLSKQHGTAALKAFGAGMKGFNEGSQQAFEDAHKTWEANTKAALDNNKMKMDEYNAILEDRALTVSEAEQKIKMIAYKYQDQMMMDADRFDLQAALVQAQVKATMDLTNYSTKLKMQKEMWDEKKKSTQDFKDQQLDKNANFDFSNAEDTEPWPSTGLTVGAVKQIGEGVAKTGNYSQAGLGIGWNPAKQAVDNYLAVAHPEFDRAKAALEYGGKTAEVKGEQGAIGRRAGTTEVGVGEFDQLIEPTRTSIHKLNMGRFKDLNAFTAAFDEHVNDPDYIEAYNNIQELQNAYTSVLIRGGVRSDAAQGLSEKTINTLFGPKGSDRALDTMAANTKRIMAGIGKAKAGTVGQDGGGGAPAGLDPDLWQHATPEEKALWQNPSQ